ncbi:DEAD/DEAH box helicase [Roseivirga sp.]|uniref:DEAD/DEAH box helicase n=1 Tax=Roseivirga sp. TaxID=1964215 RepID=UPI003B528238
MKFSDYSISDIIKGNIQQLGYKKPTDIQYKAIPAILKQEDVLAIAQTGTGKTAAFAIPTIERLLARQGKIGHQGVRCLVMVPTHELAQQVKQSFQELSRGSGLNIFAIHGGLAQDPQIKKLETGVDILVATPGRMFDLVSQGHLNLSRLEILILDEADHMLGLGFIKDIRDLMRHIPKRRQTLFFSATINDEIKKLAYSLVSNAIRIQISPKNPVAKNIAHAVAFVEMDDKRFFLENLIQNNPDMKMLVFVRTKVRAERVKKAMERVELETDTIHSDVEQKQREAVMNRFRSGKLKVLIATDISARGIDIPNVDQVINYDLPDSAEQYVHRVGRTGRGAQKGQAVSFCSSEEKEMLNLIEQNLTEPIERVELSRSDYQMVKQLSEDDSKDWRKLMKEAEAEPPRKRKKK